MKNIFDKGVNVGRISFQELEYLLLAVYEYRDREPDLGKVQDKVIEKLSKLEKEWLGV